MLWAAHGPIISRDAGPAGGGQARLVLSGVPSPGATVCPAPTPSTRPTAVAARSSISMKRMAESVLLDLCTPSPRGFARERRRRRGGGMTDRNGVLLFFFYDKT